jgi:transcriptional regulator with XRE-family HTH domain
VTALAEVRLVLRRVAGPQAETGGRSWRVREIDNDEGSRLLPTVRFTPVQRREIKKIAKSRPAEHGLPFAPNLGRASRGGTAAMTGHRSWSADRRTRLADPQVAQAAAEAREELDRREEDYRRTLSQLRNARRLTQVQLAAILGVSQAQVSRVENQADLYLSTLRSYVQAMGGELELRAVFPDGQAAAITLAELLDPADAETSRASRAGQVDVYTAFALVHVDVGGFDAAEERFHDADAA